MLGSLSALFGIRSLLVWAWTAVERREKYLARDSSALLDEKCLRIGVSKSQTSVCIATMSALA